MGSGSTGTGSFPEADKKMESGSTGNGSSQEVDKKMESGNTGSSQEEDRKQTVLFFGKTGDGRSTLGNMLLCSSVQGKFKTAGDIGSAAVSELVAVESNDNWIVIDTVGLGKVLQDGKTSTEDALSTLKKYFATNPKDVDHICFVMRKGEFNKYQRVYWGHFKEMFGRHEKHIRVIFTSAGENWVRNNEDDIKAPEAMGAVVYPMISVDFPPRDDDSHREDLLRPKREKNLTRLTKFFDLEKNRAGEPAKICQEADNRASGSETSATHSHDSVVAKVKAVGGSLMKVVGGSGR